MFLIGFVCGTLFGVLTAAFLVAGSEEDNEWN